MKRDTGVTLVEMLVVLSILVLLAGLSIGVLTSLKTKLEIDAVASGARSVIRHARNSAQETRRGSVVTLTPNDNMGTTIHAFTTTTVGLWHFENSMALEDGSLLFTGAFNLTASATKCTSTAGITGKGLEFVEPEGTITIPHTPNLSPNRGIRVEVSILPYDLSYFREEDAAIERKGTGPKGKGPYLFHILEKEGKSLEDVPGYYLHLTEMYALEIGILGAIGKDEGLIEASTFDGVVPRNRWSRVAISFHHGALSVAIDGIERSLRKLEKFDGLKAHPKTMPERLVRTTGPLVLSSPNPDRSFFGMIDELTVGSVLGGESIEVPASIKVERKIDSLRFDGRGNLDPLFHREPVVLTLRQLEFADIPGTPDPDATKVRAPTSEESVKPVEPEDPRLVQVIRVELSGAIK